jgi:5-methylcytosine-specific restriction endonuclease McrA
MNTPASVVDFAVVIIDEVVIDCLPEIIDDVLPGADADAVLELCGTVGSQLDGYVLSWLGLYRLDDHRIDCTELTVDEIWKFIRHRPDAQDLMSRLVSRATVAGLISQPAPTVVYKRPTVIPAIVRARVLDRDGHSCFNCGAVDDLEMDHKIPRSKGGTDTEYNLQTLCHPCNIAKSNHTGRKAAAALRSARSRPADARPTDDER